MGREKRISRGKWRSQDKVKNEQTPDPQTGETFTPYKNGLRPRGNYRDTGKNMEILSTRKWIKHAELLKLPQHRRHQFLPLVALCFASISFHIWRLKQYSWLSSHILLIKILARRPSISLSSVVWFTFLFTPCNIWLMLISEVPVRWSRMSGTICQLGSIDYFMFLELCGQGNTALDC